ncbi:MAG TPA: hypothetical protein VJ279_08590 [Hanamia sp.]|jgi:hypothetical protein|nr:hypothetical protein [Hanamia sp.]
MRAEFIATNDLKDLSNDLLDKNNKLKLLPSSYYRNLKWEDFRVFCHCKARYGIPTTEMIEFLKSIIAGRKTIEIGAGNGDLGHHLGIHMTDSKLQNRPEIQLEYMLMGQPTIDYPEEVEELEAILAVATHKPQVVIGSWVTTFGNPEKVKHGCSLYGINENRLLDLGIETYILIGNIDLHGDKPIMQKGHDEYYHDWHVSRAKVQENNRIWIWNK